MLTVTVKDKDKVSSDFIGLHIIPVNCIKPGKPHLFKTWWIDGSFNNFFSFMQGYCHVSLMSFDGQTIPNATIFLHISIKEEQTKIDD